MPESVTLVISNSEDVTADYLCDRLVRAGVRHSRFNTDLPLETVQLNLSDADLCLGWGGEVLRPQQIHAVVYRRPKAFAPVVAGDVFQRDHASNEWAEAVEGFLAHIPPERWLNHPARNFLASHKVHQLTQARRCGLKVPTWIVTSIPDMAQQFRQAHGPEVIAKPLASGYIERGNAADDTLIYTRAINGAHTGLFDRLPGCPVLFQSLVRKQCDVRLVVIDDRMAAVSLIAKDPSGSQRLDIRRDNMHDVEYAPMPVPAAVADSIRQLMRGYGLRFAAIDFAIDASGQWMFFEVNPNGQWAWLDLAGASDIGQMFIDAQRLPPEKPNVG